MFISGNTDIRKMVGANLQSNLININYGRRTSNTAKNHLAYPMSFDGTQISEWY